ncbi:uncharacterized protein LOC109539573 isoform X2 [Dendroctonus ponderosae]|uniref:Protein TsetseEP domain-containing protein n=1 Tax=Dendroctonus ponderosae TaxID=77166 RepID=A0AAR5PPM2_DENPD|nr:uncharacterized protein LOC109539576 isoform X2 [Dendroctonus ponderosae]XP_048522907.1 uncharacterized protein LOC109539573 isoform X2 [Dendroctonus ponderosae]
MHRLLLFCILVGLSNALIHVGHHIKNEAVKNGKLRSFLHKYANNTNSLEKCAHFDNEFNLVSSEAETCLDRTYNSDEITFCSYVKSGLRDCFNSTNALLEKCLPVKSKNVFLFMLDSTINLLKAVCAASAAEVIERYIPIEPVSTWSWIVNVLALSLRGHFSSFTIFGPASA